MANKVIGDYTAASTIDGSTHYLLIQPGSASTAYNKINRNVFLGVSGQPVDTSTSQTVGGKTFSNTNSMSIKDGSFTLQNTGDITKQAQFSLASITTGTLATYILPGASDTLAGLNATQTLLGKTLTGPVINGGSIDNSTVTVDAVLGHTDANTGNIYGVDIINGQITSASSIAPAALATGIDYSKFYNPYKFSIYRDAAGNVTAAPTVCEFDTKIFDTSNNVDVTTNKGRFTVPVNGFYQFEWQIGIPITGTDNLSILYKNGSPSAWGNEGNNSASNGSVLVESVIGDYWEIYIVANTTLSLNVGSNPVKTYFSGYLVSAT